MRTLAVVILALAGLIFGGCSLFFFFGMLTSELREFSGFLFIPISGFALAVLCYLGVRKLGNSE